MKKIQLFIACLICVMSLHAQSAFYTDSLSPLYIHVNGLRIWGEYNYNQVVAALGTPQSYTDKISTNDIDSGMRIQVYKYPSSSCFIFHNNHLVQIHLESPTDPFLIGYFRSGRLMKVGEPFYWALDVFSRGSGIYYIYPPSSDYTILNSPVLGRYMKLYVRDEGINIFFYFNEVTGYIKKIMFYTDAI